MNRNDTNDIFLVLFFIFITMLLMGCAAKDRAYRLIYVENENKERLYNFDGELCTETGLDVDPQVYEDKGYPDEVKLLYTYENCNIHRVRILEQREKLMWGVPIRPEQLKKNKRRMR